MPKAEKVQTHIINSKCHFHSHGNVCLFVVVIVTYSEFLLVFNDYNETATELMEELIRKIQTINIWTVYVKKNKHEKQTNVNTSCPSSSWFVGKKLS